MMVDKLNEAAIDLAPVVSPAQSQVPAWSAPPTVYTTLYVALQSTVYYLLHKMVVDKLNEAIIDLTPVVGPVERQVPDSMMA